MRPSDNRIKLWPVAVVGFFAVLIALSFHTGYRLRDVAPGEFRDLSVAGGKTDPEMADQYWKSAVGVLQWKFPRGTALPQNAPPEFVLLPDSDAHKKPSAGESRQLYWTQLKHLWPRPEVWYRNYEFDPSWSWRAAQSAIAGVSEFIRTSTH